MMLQALALSALLAAAQQQSGAPGQATPSGGQTGTGQTGGVGTTETEDEPGLLPSQSQAEQHNERARRRRTLRQQGSQPQFDLNRPGGQADEPLDQRPGTQPRDATDAPVPGGQQRQ